MSLPAFKQIHDDLSQKFHGRNIGMISAYRSENKPTDNESKHKSLHKDLTKLGYVVHHSEGGFVENKGKSDEKEVTEPSYLVMHKNKGSDKSKMLHDLTMLGQKYGQDSILHKPHDSHIASFHGTKEGANPELGQKADVGKAHWDHEAENSPYFSKVNGRKFTFK